LIFKKKKKKKTGCKWLTGIFLATQEVELRRTTVQGQSRQIVLRPSLKTTLHKKGLV
jgi:hypothetical protein